MRIPRTEYMMLGRLGGANFMTRPVTTPSFPQNILRHTFLNGLGCTQQMLRGLGDMATNLVDPTQGVAQTAQVQAATSNPAMPASAVPAGLSPKTRADILVGASLSLVSGTFSAIHGWKRDHTPIAVFGWGMLGMMFPIITPAVALYQGYGRRRHGR